jgi:dTDP-4-dehydrorhamnose reductase
MNMETKKLNVLVTGGNGQLGSALRDASTASPHRFIFSDISGLPGKETVFLDVTNPDAVSLICESENIDVIINCAAYTNVDKAEDDPGCAAALNIEVPRHLAEIARKRKATLIHLSTDYIFSGKESSPIPESAAPGPQNVYATSKLAGEKAVRDSACKYIIIRSAWLFSKYGHNFVKTILRLCSERDSLKVVYDQVGTPTFADDLAAFIIHIIDGGMLGKTGIYNYTNLGVISWYDFSLAIRDLAGADCEITPCLSSEYPRKARRPNYSVLDKSLVQKTFGIKIPYWYDSLKKCIEQLSHEN